MNDERNARIRSVAIMVEYNWIYLHHLYLLVSERLGSRGVATLAAGIKRYGHYRGESIRASARACTQPRSARALLASWDTAEFALASDNECLQVTGDDQHAVLTLRLVPGSEYLKHGANRQALEIYWTQFLAGVGSGYDESMRLQHDTIADGGGDAWRITIDMPVDRHTTNEIGIEDDFLDAIRAVEQARRTAAAFSAFCLYTGRELIDKFGATGEQVTREALYKFGYERAEGMRNAAEKAGKPLDFQSWFEIMQQRDPNSAAWVFRGDTHISPGVFQVTCTYCPMARAWSEQGPKGLDFGYLYDMEVHRGLVEGFNPKGVVAWDKVKTRGDSVCNFRFSIPELVTDADPGWARALSAEPKGVASSE